MSGTGVAFAPRWPRRCRKCGQRHLGEDWCEREFAETELNPGEEQ